MSHENVEIVRRAIEAWNRRDLDGAVQDLHPDAVVDWSESSGVQRGVYRGIGEIRRFWAEWLDLFEEMVVRPEAFIDAGEHVVVPNRTYMRGRDGIEVDAGSTSVWRLRNSKLIWHRLYQDKEEALAAVGLSEQDPPATSPENVETAHRFTEALLRRDYVAAVAELSPALEIDDTDIPESTGADSFHTWLARWNEAWESWRIEELEIRSAGEGRTISLFKMIVRGKGSGIELARNDALLCEFRDGKIVRIGYYNDQSQALEAAGLSEEPG